MAAPKGNEYYRLRSKDGRDRIFKKPEELAKACNEYFDWIHNNPLQDQHIFSSYGNISKGTTNRMRSMSLEGLCNFLDISMDTFKNYAKREGFLVVTTRARQIIDAQQFEGAASGVFNANIISRKLGLSDKQDVTSDGEKITGIKFTAPSK